VKNERIHGSSFATREAARMAIIDYIAAFYNRKRFIKRSTIECRQMSTTKHVFH